MPRTSSATLEFPEDTLVMLSFHFLFTRKPTPACPLLASEWYSRWPLESCETFLFSSDFSEPYHVPFHVVFFQFFFQFLHLFIFRNVLTLYVAIFSRSPLVWWFFLTQRFLAPPVCSLGGPEPPPRSQTSMHAAGVWRPWLISTFHAGYHGLPFHAGQCQCIMY